MTSPYGNPHHYFVTEVSGLGASLSEMIQGLAAWQVHAATGCGTDIALSYVKSVMLGDHGAQKPSAESMITIVSEAIALAGGESGVQ